MDIKKWFSLVALNCDHSSKKRYRWILFFFVKYSSKIFLGFWSILAGYYYFWKKRASIRHIWKPTVLHVRYITLRLLQQLLIITVFTWKFLQITFYSSVVVVVVFLHSVQLNTWYWSTSCLFFSPIWFDFSQMLRAAIGPRPTHFSCDIFDRVLGAVMFFPTDAVFIAGDKRCPQF